MTTKRIASLAMAAALAVSATGLGLAQQLQQRFDMIVRQDFFAGFAGDKEAFARAMKVTEDMLAKDPNHAAARVWHGAGILASSGQAFQKGDSQNGMKLWQQGLDEMEQAVRQAPNNVAVVIPRGATLITATRSTPPDFGRAALETGVSDFERVLKIQEPQFSQLGLHPRGELLTGLADGWSRLGNNDKAREYFERIATELKGSVYEQKARAWLENKPEAKTPAFFNCSGCHVK
ncbi:MAG TPA: hypothetical protein VER98_16705 [Terriglobia bacterium]|nr:hypothetical protein [Terriglobia bacterium]